MITVGTLHLVIISILLGHKHPALSPHAPLMRHLISLINYSFILVKVPPNPTCCIGHP